MGRLSARAIETLTGAGLGGLGAGALGALTHEPSEPLEWIDADGKLHGRRPTAQEKKQYRDRVLKAALVGAALGSGASLGGGALRRHGLSAAERAELPAVTAERLTGLKNVLEEFENAAKRATIPGTGEAALRKERVERARSTLSSQEKKLLKLLEDAEEARAGAPWGGLKLTGGGRTPVPHEELTHRGRVERYFRNFQDTVQKAYPSHPPMQSVTDPEEYGQKFFRELLKKASVGPLIAELRQIHSVEPFLASRALGRLATTQTVM